MRWRLALLGALVIGSGIAGAICLTRAAELSVRVNAIYTSGTSTTGPTARQVELATTLAMQSSVLQALAGPLAFCCLMGLVAILILLAWRWQARQQDQPTQSAATRTINAAGST